MQRVPDKVLQWLYNSLRPQYEDVDRTYSDVAKTLSNYSTLLPRTEVYTFDSGASALLLVLNGTLPVPFRGTTYRFPLAIWMPYGYPREPPMAQITPSDGMAVRPGQHVSVEGKIYHPYLAHWREHWNMSNLVDLLSILKDVFAKEPPVVAKQPQGPPPPNPPAQSPSARINDRNVQSPSENQPSSSAMQTQQSKPPPPPPKPPEVSGLPSQAESSSSAVQRAPALPPKPPQTNGHQGSSAHEPEWSHDPSVASPGLVQHNNARIAHANARISADSSAPSFNTAAAHVRRQATLPNDTSGMQRPVPFNHTPPHSTQSPQTPQAPWQNAAAYQPQHHQRTQPPPPPSSAPPQQARKPIADLLSGPNDAPLSPPPSTLPAPPIPPNPEKDAVAQTLSAALGARLAAEVRQNAAALPPLEAQHAALRRAHEQMHTELAQLEALDDTLAANEAILHAAMREADRAVDGVRARDVPKVDDVLVAPTVVGEQLYGLVADVRGISDAMFALGRALDRGRVAPDVFIKQTRTLARERFFKCALIKKIAEGMGLALDEHSL